MKQNKIKYHLKLSSSDASLIASIDNATVQLNRYLSLFIFISGIVKNILKVFVLSRPALHSNSCALIFLVSSIPSPITIISELTTRLTADWTIDLFETIAWLCKICILGLFVSRKIIGWLLKFAVVDRWLSSSTVVHRRNLTTLKNAERSIAVVTLFSLLYCYEANLTDTPAKCYAYSEACRLYVDLSFTFGTIVVPSIF